jgi:hypothetical protein
MSEADCGLCEMAGYRTCDLCGNVAFERGPLGIDICGYCAIGGDELEPVTVRVQPLEDGR